MTNLTDFLAFCMILWFCLLMVLVLRVILGAIFHWDEDEEE